VKALKNKNMENQINNYNPYSHSVGIMMLHLEWKPKYGYKMFKKEEQKILCLLALEDLHLFTK
jgi:hypothetical protein